MNKLASTGCLEELFVSSVEVDFPTPPPVNILRHLTAVSHFGHVMCLLLNEAYLSRPRT